MRSAIVRSVVLTFLVGALAFAASGDVYADKEFLIQGTIDCGRKSGQRCDLGDIITVWTADVTGTRQKANIDVSWIAKQLDTYDQDDLICIDVRVMSDGTLQGIAISKACGAPDPKRRDADDDKPQKEVVAVASAIPTAVPTTGPTFDLEVTKIAFNGFCGGTLPCIVWEVTVTNVSDVRGTGVTVIDRPGPFVDFDNNSPSQGSFDNISNVWDVGALDPGQSAVLTLETLFPQSGSYVNCADVQTADQTDIDSTPNNNNLGEDDQGCAFIVVP